MIVTTNLSDFPLSVLDKYGIEAQHPDDFICELINLRPFKVAAAAETCRKRLKNPPKSIEEYQEILRNQGLSMTVSRLQELG